MWECEVRPPSLPIRCSLVQSNVRGGATLESPCGFGTLLSTKASMLLLVAAIGVGLGDRGTTACLCARGRRLLGVEKVLAALPSQAI